MTTTEIQQAAEKRLRDLLIDLQQRQYLYKALRGDYWQGQRTHATVPRDGAALPPDLKRKVDRYDDWQTFGASLPPQLECALQVDTYSGASGSGYTVTATVEIAGELWTRTANVGPESWRVRPWEKMPV